MLNIAQFANIKFTESDNDIKEKIVTVKNILSKELIGKVPVVFVLDGVEDGKYFTIDGKSARIGRHYSKDTTSDSKDDIVLSNDYAVVTRVNQPHALLMSEGGNWYIEDSSMNGTYIDNKRLDKYKKVRLKNGDIIELGKGLSSVRLLFALPGDA